MLWFIDFRASSGKSKAFKGSRWVAMNNKKRLPFSSISISVNYCFQGHLLLYIVLTTDFKHRKKPIRFWESWLKIVFINLTVSCGGQFLNWVYRTNFWLSVQRYGLSNFSSRIQSSNGISSSAFKNCNWVKVKPSYHPDISHQSLTVWLRNFISFLSV